MNRDYEGDNYVKYIFSGQIDYIDLASNSNRWEKVHPENNKKMSSELIVDNGKITTRVYSQPNHFPENDRYLTRHYYPNTRPVGENVDGHPEQTATGGYYHNSYNKAPLYIGFFIFFEKLCQYL